ncbi:MAG: enoyl-CoA hydratase/isomerase family protein [Paracoccus sp. (in: a-proteobacteria)]|nr:enoyl-CoA hydratase/isomerase family protein [Paracoccus sp. (in: a-proteobacteria)]
MINAEHGEKLTVITLNRQDKANALTGKMLDSLCEAFDEAAASQCRAVILTGAGGVFSAGADLDEARDGLTRSERWERLSSRIATMPCLTIAALNGTLAGGAFGMALACDLRIAVPEAKFFYPVMRLGYLPQPSDPRRMHALIGPARSKALLMGGMKITAETALGWGLIDQIAAPGGLMEAARDLASDAQSASPEHVMAIKGLITGA